MSINSNLGIYGEFIDTLRGKLTNLDQVTGYISSLELQVAALEQRLREYGQHKVNCALTIWQEMSVMTAPKPRCTCGFDLLPQPETPQDQEQSQER